MEAKKIIFQTHNNMDVLLSNIENTSEGIKTMIKTITIRAISNGDTIKFNRNTEEIQIPLMDIFINNLGQNMYGVLENNVVTITYSALDYLKYLGYIPKYSKENPSNIAEFTRLYAETVFRFTIEKNANKGGVCYRLIKII